MLRLPEELGAGAFGPRKISRIVARNLPETSGLREMGFLEVEDQSPGTNGVGSAMYRAREHARDEEGWSRTLARAPPTRARRISGAAL